jgi:hypothetical protein
MAEIVEKKTFKIAYFLELDNLHYSKAPFHYSKAPLHYSKAPLHYSKAPFKTHKQECNDCFFRAEFVKGEKTPHFY